MNPCLGVRLLNLPLVYHPYAHLQDKRRLQTPIKHKQQTKIMCFCCFVSLVFIVSGVWVWCVAVWFCCFVDACPTCRQAWLLESLVPSDLAVIGSQVFLGVSLEALTCQVAAISNQVLSIGLVVALFFADLSGVGRASFRVSGGRKEGVGGAGPRPRGSPPTQPMGRQVLQLVIVSGYLSLIKAGPPWVLGQCPHRPIGRPARESLRQAF